MLMGEVRADGLLRAIDPAVRDSMTAEQVGAIRDAVRKDTWREHPVDLRLSLPPPFDRFYLTLVAGWERRSFARRVVERERRPLGRRAHLIVIAGVVATVGFAGVAIWLLASGACIL